MAFHSMQAFRITTRRVAWALLLGGGITLALAAEKEEAGTYFDPLPRSEGRDAKAREKARARQPLEGKPAGGKMREEAREQERRRGSRYAALEDCAHGFADAAERALPSVVSVMSRTGTGRAVDGLGSGVVAGPRGHVLTSAHVVAGARALRVRFHDGSEADAVLVAADRATDVAVLRIRGEDGMIDAMRPIRFGDPERLRVGEWVVAIGSPYGLSETVTTGVVSAKGRRRTGANGFGGLIQTDAALNPGSSGGALVDLQGRLVGLNTARVAPVGRAGGDDRHGGNAGIGFAVPADLARKVMEDLIRDGHATRGWLGVSVADVADAARGGVRVEGVARGGPADKAGLRRGDVIAALDGRNVEDTDDLLGRVGMARPGSTLALEVLRSGNRMEMEVRLGRRAPPPSSRGGGGTAVGDGDAGAGPRLGMGVAKADAALRKRYGLEKDDDGLLVVTSLDKDGGARAAGIRAGDLILEADGREVSDAEDLRAAVAAARKSGVGTVTLRVRRDGEAFSVDVRIGPGSA